MKDKLLILDLDETLVYAVEKPLEYECSFMAGQYHVYERPYVREFLEYCNSQFFVAIWTSSNEAYADAVVSKLFGSKYPLEFVWSRNKCVQKLDPEIYEYYFIKDLKKVKNKGFNLSSIIMIDDTPKKLMRNYGNLVRVVPFEGNQRDEELLDLMVYLEELKLVPNVRVEEKRGWKSKIGITKLS